MASCQYLRYDLILTCDAGAFIAAAKTRQWKREASVRALP
jgi:hypothetical protein